MKPIFPSRKERKRYILIKLDFETKVEKEDISKLVIQAGLQFLGELGMARAGIQFLAETWDKNNMTGIVRTNNECLDETKAALTLVKEFGGKPARISCLKVSGSISKLKMR